MPTISRKLKKHINSLRRWKVISPLMTIDRRCFPTLTTVSKMTSHIRWRATSIFLTSKSPNEPIRSRTPRASPNSEIKSVKKQRMLLLTNESMRNYSKYIRIYRLLRTCWWGHCPDHLIITKQYSDKNLNLKDLLHLFQGNLSNLLIEKNSVRQTSNGTNKQTQKTTQQS